MYFWIETKCCLNTDLVFNPEVCILYTEKSIICLIARYTTIIQIILNEFLRLVLFCLF